MSESDARSERRLECEERARLNEFGGGAPEGEPVMQRDAFVVLQVAGVAHRVPRGPAARLERRAGRTGLVEQQLEVGPLDDAVFVRICAHVVLVQVRAEAERGSGRENEFGAASAPNTENTRRALFSSRSVSFPTSSGCTASATAAITCRECY